MNRFDCDDYPLGSALEFLRSLWRVNHALEKLSSAWTGFRRDGTATPRHPLRRQVSRP
jgi:hypothetical protein